MTDVVKLSWVGSPGSGSLANTLARELNAELERVAELERIVELERVAEKVIHCESCGDSWYDSGICAASCPHCRLARLREAAKAVLKIADRNTDEFNALHAALAEKP